MFSNRFAVCGNSRRCREGRKTAMAFACCTMFAAISFAQSTTDSQGTAPRQSTTQQKLPMVTTTVLVQGEIHDDYLPEAVTVGTLDGATLQQAPLSAMVVTRDLMSDQVARVLSDVVKNDASIGEDYAPIGYYGNFEIRGYPIDLATGLEINGLTIAGEQDVPLENKQSVEFLKGIAGIESGVASAGGLINYVTKKPITIQAIDMSTDHRGSAYGAVDLGRLFGSRKQVGTRLNLAGEHMKSYVNGADGWRAMGAGAADWKLTPKAILNANFEYQHKNQRSVCGYQLLGGTTVPDINRIYTSTMLGEQSWEKPNTFDTFNTDARLDYDLPHAWRAFIAGSFSHSLIDDNVVYAYGNSIAAPYYFFAPDGTYDIYDYRNPGELRMNAVAEGIVAGHVTTGAITHDLTAGGTIFLRSVHQPGFYTVDNPTAPDGTGQDGSVYYYAGSENIYEPITPVDLDAVENPHQSAGPRRLWEDNHQAALVMQDRMHLPGHIQLLAAGRYDSLRDHNYSAYASDPTAATTFTDKSIWLPQFAVTYNPIDQLTLYGNYGVLMSLGPQAPWWVDNSNQFLVPFFTRQAEIGAKFEPSQRLLITADIFRMRAPFFYPKLISTPDSVCDKTFDPTSADNLCFESEGHETHSGAELDVGGKVTNWLRLSGSLAAMHAISDDTGTTAFDNKQVLNVPRVRTALFADVAVPHTRGLHLLPGWGYTGRKEATRDATASVPSYNLFNMGARYTPRGESGRMTFRIYADNIANKRYWKDTGASLGDTFIHLGAPTTVRLSAHYTF